MLRTRIIYLDVLRVLATLAVILLHVCAQDWSYAPIDSVEWHIYNFGDSISRWGVPIFVMISGALFMDSQKKIDTKKLFSKNILRIATAFLFWSVAYMLNSLAGHQRSVEVIITKIISGQGHMWFLLMLIGLYITIPVLRSVCSNEQTMRYFLYCSFFLNIFSKTLLYAVAPLVHNHLASLLLDLFKSNYAQLGIETFLGYSFYFVMGYYLHSNKQNGKVRTAAYIGTIVGFATTIALTHFASVKMGYKYIAFYDDLTLNVMLQSMGIFIFIKNINWNFNARMYKFVQALSKWSFGIYLVHGMVIEKLSVINISVWTFHPLISVPMVFIAVFIVSSAISAVLNKIPILNRYIV